VGTDLADSRVAPTMHGMRIGVAARLVKVRAIYSLPRLPYLILWLMVAS
jgi:hypothetical protein